MAFGGTTFEPVSPFLLDLLSFLFQTLQSAFYEIEASKRIKARAVRWPMRFHGPLLPEIETAASLYLAWALLFHSRPEVPNKQLVLTRDASKQIDRQ